MYVQPDPSGRRLPAVHFASSGTTRTDKKRSYLLEEDIVPGKSIAIFHNNFYRYRRGLSSRFNPPRSGDYYSGQKFKTFITKSDRSHLFVPFAYPKDNSSQSIKKPRLRRNDYYDYYWPFAREFYNYQLLLDSRVGFRIRRTFLSTHDSRELRVFNMIFFFFLKFKYARVLRVHG